MTKLTDEEWAGPVKVTTGFNPLTKKISSSISKETKIAVMKEGERRRKLELKKQSSVKGEQHD